MGQQLPVYMQCVCVRCVCVCVCVCVCACVRDRSACIDLLRLSHPRISKRGDGIGHGVTGRHVSVIICIVLAVFPFHPHLHAVVCTMPGDKNACGKIECALNSEFTRGSEACVCVPVHACVRACILEVHSLMNLRATAMRMIHDEGQS